MRASSTRRARAARSARGSGGTRGAGRARHPARPHSRRACELEHARRWTPEEQPARRGSVPSNLALCTRRALLGRGRGRCREAVARSRQQRVLLLETVPLQGLQVSSTWQVANPFQGSSASRSVFDSRPEKTSAAPGTMAVEIAPMKSDAIAVEEESHGELHQKNKALASSMGKQPGHEAPSPAARSARRSARPSTAHRLPARRARRASARRAWAS